jgi:hypothetical protein
VSGIEYWLVSLSNSEREPSLLALWVNSLSKVVVLINKLKDGKVNILGSSDKSLNEHNFQAAVEVEEILIIGRRILTFKSNVLICQI